MITTESYFWNDSLPTGNILYESITTDIMQFENFIKSLDLCGYEFKGYNSEGVIINYKEILPTPIPVDSTHENRIITLENSVYSFEGKIVTLECNIETSKKTEPVKEEVTDEFFLLLDMLPEHIRKEIKIYIK